MATQSMTTSAPTAAFERCAAFGAYVTGISSVLYAVAFLILKQNGLASFLLGLGGFTGIFSIAALYNRVREADSGFALLALLLGAAAGLGTALHGIYNLALVITPPAGGILDLSTLPLQIDPRGFLAFGVAGISALLFAGLIARTNGLPRGLSTLGYVLALSLIALFLGALLTGNDAKSLAVLIPGALASLIATPAWYLWIGSILLRRPATAS